MGLDTDICVQLDKNNSVDTLVALQPTKLSVIIEGARAGSGQPIQAEAEAVAVCHTHAQANQDLQQRLQGLVRSTKAALSAAAEAAAGSEQQG